ncbi:DegT/DnrJ/EryC1/StrS family aminotransferase [Thalassospira xiamenensis]|uniref:DegT/DnrJ/EryC1/StrS family aminotransferase n=1 Tax=Thalassospira xiamenensis TaxID=220697 RepID=UPI000DED6FF9|nr:DegT/DnrJ/EryC1/StrS family aminotransferase [Thalassospira xiamenensis]RCK33579.1 hypothetical protein TH24_21260 [Thalassospira xiamenensis]
MIRFPYSKQSITSDDISAVNRVLAAPFLTQGPEIRKFEIAFERVTGARNAVAVSNGTAALHLAYVAAGVSRSKGLICPPVTFLATAAAAKLLCAPVAFSDVDPITGLMTPETLRAAFEKVSFDIAAVTCVHLGGRMCDLSGLKEVCDEYGALLIEDACHAPGAKHTLRDGRTVAAGSCEIADYAAFSFHPVKHIAMGEGGAVCCKRPEDFSRLSTLRNHGIDRSKETLPIDQEVGPWSYVNTEIGWNYRLTDIQAALGSSQLMRFKSSLDRRRMLSRIYDQSLSAIDHVTPAMQPDNPSEHSWHLYAVALDFACIGKSRSEVMEDLAVKGIGTQVHYIPLYRHPTYAACGRSSDFPGAEQYYQNTLSIPLYPGLMPDDIDLISHALAEVLDTKNN